MSSDKDTKGAEMEEKVDEEMRLVEEEKNCKENHDVYTQMVENMTGHFEKLSDFYNQLVVMQLESVKTKLEYLKCRQDLENINIALESYCGDAEDVQK